MFLIDPILAHFHLNWTQQYPIIHPLLPHIKRTSVPTPSGPLELPICEPKPMCPSSNTSPSQTPLPPPIFFLYGGMGYATVWLEWLTYLHSHKYPPTLYAFSVRGQGASHCPKYRTLVHDTTFEDILSDAADCLSHITQLRKQSTSTSATQSTRTPILIGHFSSGSLAQALSHGTYKSPYPDNPLSITASGLYLVDAIPHYGSLEMCWNWIKNEPSWLLRSIYLLLRPMFPLSTTELVQNAFFGRKFPGARAEEFMMGGFRGARECNGLWR